MNKKNLNIFSKLLLLLGVASSLLLISALALAKPAEQIEEQILQRWSGRKHLISLGQEKAAMQYAEKILALKWDSGIPNLPQLSAGLIAEAKENKDRQQQRKLFNLAIALSPEYAFTYGSKSSHFLAVKNLNLPEAFSALKSYLSIISKDAFMAAPIIFHWATILKLLIEAIIYALVIILTFNKFPLFYARLRESISKAIPDLLLISGILTIIAIALLYLGPWGILLLLTPIFWKYSQLQEKFVLAIILFIAACYPLLSSLQQSTTEFNRNHSSYTFYHAERSFEPGQKVSSLTQLASQDPDNLEVLFNLALYYKRRGMLEQALKTIDQVLAKRPSWALALINKGIILSGLGRDQEVYQYFSQAAQLAGDKFSVNYNLGKILFRRAMIDDARGYLRAAQIIDDKRFSVVEEESKKSNLLNRQFVEARLSPPASKEIFQSLWRNSKPLMTTCNLTPLTMSWLLLAWIIVSFVVSKLFFNQHKPQYCNSCGQTFINKDNDQQDFSQTCIQCLTILQNKMSAEPLILQKKEKQIKLHSLIKGKLSTVVGFFLPGSIQIIQNFALLGLTIISALFATIVFYRAEDSGALTEFIFSDPLLLLAKYILAFILAICLLLNIFWLFKFKGR